MSNLFGDHRFSEETMESFSALGKVRMFENFEREEDFHGSRPEVSITYKAFRLSITQV